jgi:hypothetical protein
MKKIALWIGLCVLVAAIVAAVVYWQSRPQVIIVRNGLKLTLVGVTYGKHHVFKGIKTGTSRVRGRTTLDTTNDTLVVWIESQYKSMQYPNYQLLIYDPAHTACVSAWQRTGNSIRNGLNVQGFVLDAFPRRGSKIVLRVADWGNGGGMRPAKGEFVISNPGPRSFPDWTPDALPNTQSDGDLDVTLTKCSWGKSELMFGNMNASPGDPMRNAVSVVLHTEQGGNVVTNWQPVAIVTSDATGNHTGLNSWSNSRSTNGDASMSYQWGLWPEEKAWKLRVEMSRDSGFSNDEEWAISNLPVGKGDWSQLWNYNNNMRGMNHHAETPFAETTLQGVHLKIFPAIQLNQNVGMGNNQTLGGFHIVADPGLPDGFRMSLIEATDENGHKLQTYGFGPNGNGNGNYVFQLPDIRNSKSLNLTIAIHQSRFVEFAVKPSS